MRPPPEATGAAGKGDLPRSWGRSYWDAPYWKAKAEKDAENSPSTSEKSIIKSVKPIQDEEENDGKGQIENDE